MFLFHFVKVNLSKKGSFPQVKILLLAETKAENMFHLQKKPEIFLLAESKAKILFCLGKQKLNIFCSDML